jgi:hypothetical protein
MTLAQRGTAQLTTAGGDRSILVTLPTGVQADDFPTVLLSLVDAGAAAATVQARPPDPWASSVSLLHYLNRFGN